MKHFIKKILGPKNLGRLDYWFRPHLKTSWGGAFNGQSFRQQIFQELVQELSIRAIVETGTFRGTTTEYMAGTGLPIYTVESHPRYFAYASTRLRALRSRVKLFEGDSRTFLKRLAQDVQVPKKKVFFYLDAHWLDDLPLLEELKLVFSTWQESVVMVDDFKVPGEAYGYDDYGPGKTLDVDYLQPLSSLNLHLYFPAAGVDEETGAKRGCVVLACGENGRVALDALQTLRRNGLAQ